MNRQRIPHTISMSFLLGFLGIFLLAGCGSNTTTGSTTSTLSSSALTATACARLTRPSTSTRAVTGTLQSISGQTLMILSRQGSSVSVNYTSTTRFTQEKTIASSALKEGTSAIILVTSSGSGYAATTITLNNGTTGFTRGSGTGGGRFGGSGASGCFTRTGTGSGATGTSNFRGLVGTITQVSGSSLTITDSTGADYSVTITSQTQIVETVNATAAALKTGEALTVSGTASSQGAITARTVMILLKLPTGPATPPATP